ncbi:MAG: class I SAM-dependent methyltransferase [Alphaproteobacteria bacterium]|nr:class I SAM-dependent methyltransferase [Alphaproteobacteria bacterium]
MSAQSYKTFRFFLRDALRFLGLEVSRYRPRGQENLPTAIPDQFKTLYKKYHAFSMVKWPGLYTAFNAVDHITKHKVDGAIVECGVWKGGCTAIMAEHLAGQDDIFRDFYLYDTYEGMSAPTDKDFSFFTNKKADDLYQSYQKDGKSDWSVGALETVKEVLEKTGYPTHKIHTVKGKVEDTIPETMPDKIAVLRLDTDWYESTKHELEHLFPRLVKGGVLIVDDYGAWAGSKQAVDEYFEKNICDIYFHYDASTGNICGVKS